VTRQNDITIFHIFKEVGELLYICVVQPFSFFMLIESVVIQSEPDGIDFCHDGVHEATGNSLGFEGAEGLV